MAATAAASSDSALLQEAIRDYIADVIEEEGAFYMEDGAHEQVRQLEWLQEGATGMQAGEATGRALMKDVQTGESLELEFELELFEGSWEVVDAHIVSADAVP
jgi:hypothetical protein